MSNTNQRKHGKVLDLLIDNIALVILIVLCVVGTIATKGLFVSPTNLRNVVRQICVSSIIGIGFTCVIASGNLDLSVGTMLGMLGVIIALISKTALGFWGALGIGLCIGAACGGLNGIIGVKLRLPLFIVTLATGQVFKGICYLLSNTSPISGLPAIFKTIGQGHWGPVPIPVYIMMFVGLIVYVLLNKTIFGRHAIATGGNREAARTSGINVGRTTILVYTLMGICNVVAAVIMTGRAASAQPAAGQGMEMDAIAAVVIGGTPLSGGYGKIVGTMIGCLIVGVIANVLNLIGMDSNWQLIAKGFMILCAVGLDVLTTLYVNAQMRRMK
jgi:ribose/xylose/arabinose/galactoside ABC-type transport system permease subunit